MDDKEVRRKILEIIYETEKKEPGSEIQSLDLMIELNIEQEQLDFNARYLKEAEFISLHWYAGAFEAGITHKGIDLVESKDKLNNLFGASELKAFISYSTKDESAAAYAKELLEYFDIKCIMAPDSINGAKEWMNEIIKEIEESNIFIPLLSYNFKDSNWCPQEAGIAYYVKYHVKDPNDFQINPLWIDKTEPFGFLSRIQGKKFNNFNLIGPIFDLHQNYMIKKSITALRKIKYGYRETEMIMGLLQPHFGDLSNVEVNKLVDIVIKNDQIYDAGKCRDEYIPNFIDINEDRIEKNKLEKLQEILNEY